MAKKKIGRPTVYTPETISKLEYAFSIGCTDLEACLHANVSKSSLYDYQNAHPEFLERKGALKEKQVLKSREVIASAIAEGDKQTAQWYLERKKKDEFSTRNVLAGDEDAPLRIITVEHVKPNNQK